MELPSYTKQWHNDVHTDIDASRPELSVKGKRVVVTGGGSGGIGAATAEAFAVAGAAEVVILGRTKKTLEATKAAIIKRHPDTSVIPIVADITNAESTTNAFDFIAKRGQIDIFISNAGSIYIGKVATSDPVEWFKDYELIIKGGLLAVQAALQNLSTGGVIINVNSAAAHVPFVPGYSSYSTAKIASAKMFEYLHHENPDYSFFNLQPGIIESTSLASKATEGTGISFPQQDTVELPGNFMVWLSSPEAAFLRGRYVWANWDVKELMEKKEKLEQDPTLLTIGLLGWP